MSASWIPEVLKHFQIGRAGVGAVFLAAAVLLFVPAFKPAWIPVLPEGWRLLAIGALVLSGCLLLVWMMEALGAWVAGLWQWGRRAWNRMHLSKEATTLLRAFRGSALDTVDVRHFKPSGADPFYRDKTAFHIAEYVRQLEAAGLVWVSSVHPSEFGLTAAGLKFVLEKRLFESQDGVQGRRA